jgi:hypothetical protein
MMIAAPIPVYDSCRPAFRTRDICFSPADWRRVDEAVASHYPRSTVIRGATGPERIAQTIPSISKVNRLSDLMEETGQLPFESEIGFDPAWEPDFRLLENDAGWMRNPLPLPIVRILQYQAVWDPQGTAPEHLCAGRIEISCQPGNDNHLTFARQFFDLIGKMSTNRNQVRLSVPGYNVDAVQEKGSRIWLGFDAIRWAREDKQRLLYYKPGWGLRPNDEGIVKAWEG